MTDDARQLVEELVAAGEWPDPDQIQRIIDQGEPAVDPLLEIIRRTDLDEVGTITRSYAVGILEYIASPRAASWHWRNGRPGATTPPRLFCASRCEVPAWAGARGR